MENKRLKKINLYYAVLISGLILLLAGILSLAVSRDLKYTELKDYFVLSVSGIDANPDDIDVLVTELAKNKNVAKVDRVENKIYFQNSNLSAVESIATEKIKEPNSYSIEEILTSTELKNELIFLGKVALVFVASIFGLISFYALKKTSARIEKGFAYLFVFSIFTLALSAVELLGGIAALSNIYMVKQIDLMSLLVIPFYIMFVVAITANEHLSKKVISLSEVIVLTRKSTKENFFTVAKISAILFLIPILGFGKNYVVFSILCVLSLVITTLNLYVVDSAAGEIASRATLRGKSPKTNEATVIVRKNPVTKPQKRVKNKRKK